MSPNVETAQEATLLFVAQLRQRPDNVLANLNCLLDGESFKLELVRNTPLTPQSPQEASLYDHMEPYADDEGGPAAFPIRTGEKGGA